MEKIIIVSKNKAIVSKEELLSLAKNITSRVGADVFFSAPEQLGTQVTFHDVVELWIEFKVTEKILDTLFDLFKDWAKEKLKQEKKPRPKSVTIYGSDGQVVSGLTVDENGEAQQLSEKKNVTPFPPKNSEPFF